MQLFTWIVIQHVGLSTSFIKVYVTVLCFMDQLTSRKHFDQFDTLLYFIMNATLLYVAYLQQ